jgi:nucleoside permease NupC
VEVSFSSHHARVATFATGVDAAAILAASIMSAPAALAISKVAYPETEGSATATDKKKAYEVPESGDTNA